MSAETLPRVGIQLGTSSQLELQLGPGQQVFSLQANGLFSDFLHLNGGNGYMSFKEVYAVTFLKTRAVINLKQPQNPCSGLATFLTVPLNSDFIFLRKLLNDAYS